MSEERKFFDPNYFNIISKNYNQVCSEPIILNISKENKFLEIPYIKMDPTQVYISLLKIINDNNILYNLLVFDLPGKSLIRYNPFELEKKDEIIIDSILKKYITGLYYEVIYDKGQSSYIYNNISLIYCTYKMLELYNESVLEEFNSLDEFVDWIIFSYT